MIRFALLLLFFTSFTPALRAQDEVVAVVVAAQALPRGTSFDAVNTNGDDALVIIAFYPANSLPEGALQNPSDLIGSILRTDIAAETPILSGYLFPIAATDAALPPPIAEGQRVTRELGTYREFRYENLDQINMPARLAAGDAVDIIASTDVSNIFQDESHYLLTDVVVAERNASSITFSLLPEQIDPLSQFLSTGLTITLILKDPVQPAEADFNAGQNLVNWEYLLNRLDNPLIIPDGADFSALEN